MQRIKSGTQRMRMNREGGPPDSLASLGGKRGSLAACRHLRRVRRLTTRGLRPACRACGTRALPPRQRRRRRQRRLRRSRPSKATGMPQTRMLQTVAGRLGPRRSLGGSSSPRPARHVIPGALLLTPRGVHGHRTVSAEHEVVVGFIGMERDGASVPDPDAPLRLRAAAAGEWQTYKPGCAGRSGAACVDCVTLLLKPPLRILYSKSSEGLQPHDCLWMPGQPSASSRSLAARVVRARLDRPVGGCAQDDSTNPAGSAPTLAASRA